MITLKNIIDRFEVFVEKHLLLRTFSSLSPSNVDLDKFEIYPILHLVYNGSSYDLQQKTYNFEVYLLDLPPNKTDKVAYQTELLSSAEQAAEDIIADMKYGGKVFVFDYEFVLTSASVTPLEETTSNVLAGVLLDISITVGFDAESCFAPITP